MRPHQDDLLGLSSIGAALVFLVGCAGEIPSGAGDARAGTEPSPDRGASKGPDGSHGPESFPSFFGIAWRGTPADNLTYARQVGYDYVFYQPGMEKEPLADGIRFFLESPDLNSTPGTKEINLDTKYSAEDQALVERIACWRGTGAFPSNLATGWQRSSRQFTIVLDWQQQKVIDWAVEAGIKEVKRILAANPKMIFAGVAWDEANLHGSFESQGHSRQGSRSLLEVLAMVPDALSSLGDLGMSSDELLAQIGKAAAGEDLSNTRLAELTYHPKIGPIIHFGIPLFNTEAHFPVPVSYWTGNGSCLKHGDVTHEYPTFSDGIIAYLKTMMRRARELNPEAKWIVEPYSPHVEWASFIIARDDNELVPSFFSEESAGLAFVDDARLFVKGYLQPSRVGSSAPNEHGEKANRVKAARAALVGSWFNWYGRFGGSGDMPNYQSVREVPARLLLIRLVPNWDNLAQIPLAQRSWDGQVYSSPNSTVSAKLIATRQPNTRKLFIVFLTPDATLSLREGETVASIAVTDSLFRPTADGAADLRVSGQTLSATAQTKLESTAYVISLK